MKLKTTLFLLINLLYFSQVEAQSCNGADFETNNGIAVLELTPNVPSGFNNESISGATGGRAATYRGSNNFSQPGSVTTYKLKVNSAGTYRVQWRSKISIIATNGLPPNTEHNDSWLKINGSDFFGLRGSSKVYPNGSGRTPIAHGNSANGFMKIYTNSVNWSWVTYTNDGNGHDVFVTFSQAGVYNVQIGGRSNGHTIDRIVLYKSNVSSSSALSTSRAETTCSGGGTSGTNNAPTVSITSPSNGQSFNAGSNITVNLSASDSDGSIQKHEIFVNGSKVDTDGSSYSPYILRNVSNGSYAIKATVTDNGGKTASSTVNISVGGDVTPPPTGGNTAPTVSFTNLTNGAQVNPGSTVSVGVSASDSDGSVVKYQVFVNGQLVDTDGTNYTPHPIRNIAAGNYSIKVTVTDNDGATNSSTVNITAGDGVTPPTGGNAAPTVSFTNLTNGAQVNPGSTVSVGVSASDSDGSVVKYQVFVNGQLVDTDGSNYTPHPIRNIAAGNHTIKVTVTDNDGATNSSTVNISAGTGGGNAAPTVSFTNLTNGAQVSPGSTVSVGVSASDSDGSVVKYQVFVNGQLVDTDGSNYTPHPIRNIAAGNYSIKVTVTDNDGATNSSTVNITAGTSTSIASKSAFLFPNPVQTDGRVSVRLPEGSSGQFEYSVTNSLGIQIERGSFKASSSNRDVQLSLTNTGEQVQGVYYMTLKSNGSKKTIPLIRE